MLNPECPIVSSDIFSSLPWSKSVLQNVINGVERRESHYVTSEVEALFPVRGIQ